MEASGFNDVKRNRAVQQLHKEFSQVSEDIITVLMFEFGDDVESVRRELLSNTLQDLPKSKKRTPATSHSRAGSSSLMSSTATSPPIQDSSARTITDELVKQPCKSSFQPILDKTQAIPPLGAAGCGREARKKKHSSPPAVCERGRDIRFKPLRLDIADDEQQSESDSVLEEEIDEMLYNAPFRIPPGKYNAFRNRILRYHSLGCTLEDSVNYTAEELDVPIKTETEDRSQELAHRDEITRYMTQGCGMTSSNITFQRPKAIPTVVCSSLGDLQQTQQNDAESQQVTPTSGSGQTCTGGVAWGWAENGSRHAMIQAKRRLMELKAIYRDSLIVVTSEHLARLKEEMKQYEKYGISEGTPYYVLKAEFDAAKGKIDKLQRILEQIPAPPPALLFSKQSEERKREIEIDFHGYTRSETKAKLVEEINNNRSFFTSKGCVLMISCITGRGVHSNQGKPVVRETVRSFARKNGIRIVDDTKSLMGKCVLFLKADTPLTF